MQHHQGAAAAQSTAVGATDPDAGGPDGGLGWLVESGLCPSLAEAESLRDRALVCHEDDAAGGGDGRRPGIARWRRWLEIGRPDPDPDAVRQAVLFWHIRDLGNHSRHHLVRDLLHASLLRDRRTAAFHRKTLEPEPWVEARVAHLADRHRQSAIQHTTLDVMNRRLIGLLWRELEGRLGPPDPERLVHGEDFGLLLALWACQPVGALLDWRGGADHVRDFGDGGCRHGRVCPWCHARRVMDLHTRLMDGPCRPARLRGKCLVRVRVTIASGLLPYHTEFADFACGRGYDAGPPEGSIGTRRFLDPEEVRLVRLFWGKWLSTARKKWGVEGGVITHQVEPLVDRQSSSEEPEHRHELTLVGSFPASHFGYVAGGHDRFGMGFTNDRVAPVLVDVFRGEDPQALRLLLAGPPYQFHHPRGLLYENWRESRSLGDHSGALRLAPWFLADSAQWWSHFQATRDSKLFSAFGTWKEALGGAAGPARRRIAPLKRHNEQNGDQALGRRERLLVDALPVFTDLAARTARRPGHSALRAALARHLGREVSDRDARWLSSKLNEV